MNSNLRSKKQFVAIFFCLIFVVRQSCFKSIIVIDYYKLNLVALWKQTLESYLLDKLQ